MSRTNGTRRYALPLRIHPQRGQVTEHVAESGSKESWDVLHDDVVGSKLANESRELRPQPSFV
jgi:hypothetical protein